MKALSIIPGLLALVLCGVLFYQSGHKAVPVAPAATTNTVAGAGFSIAYFNLDSLEAHYNYFKDVLDQVKAKENSMNTELNGMEKGYQRKIAEWQKKGSTMTQAENQAAQQEYAQMQQNYQVRKQNLQESLMKHNEDMKADIRQKIQAYLDEYNKKKKYSYILSYESNNFIYVKDSAYDITPDLISGLNAEYKSKDGKK